MRTKIIPFMVAVCLVPRFVCADVFLLSSGGQLEGDVLNREDNPRLSYVIKTTSGGMVTIPSNQVKRVVSQNDAKVRYADNLTKMPNTVDGHSKMAEWCSTNGLSSEREYHMREIIRLEPENEKARKALGFLKKNGEWVTMRDVMVAQGMVYHQGKWRFQQDLDMENLRKRAFDNEIHWRKEVKLLHGKILSSNPGKAMDELKAIRDPAAAPAIANLLKDTRESTDMRRIYVDLLARMNTGASIAALCQGAIYDEDDSVRDRCLDALVDNGERQAIKYFLHLLDPKKNSNVTVNRAGAALGRFKDPDTTLALINALKTQHKHTVQTGGGGISLGAGGMSVGGGGPKVFIEQKDNSGVLSGLTSIHPGINYQYDQEAWKQWYSDSNAPKSFQMRRDP